MVYALVAADFTHACWRDTTERETGCGLADGHIHGAFLSLVASGIVLGCGPHAGEYAFFQISAQVRTPPQ
jgi:hypothetical protein